MPGELAVPLHGCHRASPDTLQQRRKLESCALLHAGCTRQLRRAAPCKPPFTGDPGSPPRAPLPPQADHCLQRQGQWMPADASVWGLSTRTSRREDQEETADGQGGPQLQETQGEGARCSVPSGLTGLGLELGPYAATGGGASGGLVPAEPFSPPSLPPRGAGTATACPCQQGTLSPTDLALREESGAQPKREEPPTPTPGPPLSQGEGAPFSGREDAHLCGAAGRGPGLEAAGVALAG